jgi:hypothetical protein
VEILLNKKMEAKIISDRSGQALLDEYRIRVVRHYSVPKPPLTNRQFLII